MRRQHDDDLFVNNASFVIVDVVNLIKHYPLSLTKLAPLHGSEQNFKIKLIICWIP